MKKTLFAAAAIIMLLLLTFTSVSASSLPFTDVAEEKWYTPAVAFCYENGYMNGTSADKFSPSVSLSRGMVATILAAVGEYNPEDYLNKTSFVDVPVGKWYCAPIEWAHSKGIVAGYGDDFRPNNPITREQLAVMLYAFAGYAGLDTSARADDLETRFNDASKISSWSTEAVSWAIASEIISGTNNGAVNPKGTATRAEAAMMIYKFCKLGLEKASDFTVSRAFGDHMTVQRDKQLSVWGWAGEAEEGKIVNVFFKGEKATARIENCEWKAVFDKTFEASAEPAEITVSGLNKKVTFSDVLVGDVYYVMGQSNVYWPMQLVVDDLKANRLDEEIADLTYDKSTNIRLFRNSHVFQVGKTGEDAWGTAKLYKDVDSDYAVWARPDDFDENKPFDVNTEFIGGRSFSAIGYLFALKLSSQTDVPIAMIEIDASGYPLTAWAPNELAEKWGTDVPDQNGVFWFRIGEQVYPQQSRMAYNQQLYPLMNFSCAGILWYQGESDCLNTILQLGKDAWSFSNEVTDLMNYYREHMGAGDDDFPVYFIEFPACFQYNNTAAYLPTGVVRSELGCVPMMLENSYVVPCSDLWNNVTWWNNIHPFCKPAQAERAVNMVLANEYGIGDIEKVAGPQLTSVEFEDEYNVILTFKYVGDGLTVFTEDLSGDIYGLEVLYSETDRTVWGGAANVEVISTNQIRVTDDFKILGVRYGAETEAYYPARVNVTNSEDIPMVAFAYYTY